MKLPERLAEMMDEWESNDAYGDIRIIYKKGKVTGYHVNLKLQVEKSEVLVNYELIDE